MIYELVQLKSMVSLHASSLLIALTRLDGQVVAVVDDDDDMHVPIVKEVFIPPQWFISVAVAGLGGWPTRASESLASFKIRSIM